MIFLFESVWKNEYTVGENGILGEIGIYMHDRGNKCIMSL